MFTKFVNWIHHLFNPHCAECGLEKIEASTCQSCETLKLLLDQERHEKKMLLEFILEQNRPKLEVVKPQQDYTDVNTQRQISWNARRLILEADDRIKANLLKRHAAENSKLSTEKLEEEIKKEPENARENPLGEAI